MKLLLIFAVSAFAASAQAVVCNSYAPRCAITTGWANGSVDSCLDRKAHRNCTSPDGEKFFYGAGCNYDNTCASLLSNANEEILDEE